MTPWALAGRIGWSRASKLMATRPSMTRPSVLVNSPAVVMEMSPFLLLKCGGLGVVVLVALEVGVEVVNLEVGDPTGPSCDVFDIEAIYDHSLTGRYRRNRLILQPYPKRPRLIYPHTQCTGLRPSIPLVLDFH